MLDFKLKIGLVPDVRDLGDFKTRKGIFEPAKGVENKNMVVKYIKEHFSDDITEFCDLEWLNEMGVLYKNSDCGRVCDYLKEHKVDAIFIINCNFGNEEACCGSHGQLRQHFRRLPFKGNGTSRVALGSPGYGN